MTGTSIISHSDDQLFDRIGSTSGEIQFLRYLLTGRIPDLYSNITTDGAFLRADETALPLTINRREFENSYVCSPYSAYISYTQEELKLLKNPILIRCLRSIIAAGSHLLKAGQINKVVQVNNWLCSTNLYPKLSYKALSVGTKSLLELYPQHAVMFRSLNEYTNTQLIKDLGQLGYELFPSRQIYVFDTLQDGFAKKRMLQSDFSLLKKTEFNVVNHEQIVPEDYDRITQLYRELYILKHSSLNPQITTDYIRLNHEHRLLEFKGLRDQEGVLQGVIGYFAKEGVLATHLVGYNTSLPQNIGIYRLLSALLFQEAIRKKLVLNFSSGAANFKKLRGGKPVIEFSAIYSKHLPTVQRVVWTFLRLVSQHIGIKILRKFEL
jgi:hypothetical protein